MTFEAPKRDIALSDPWSIEVVRGPGELLVGGREQSLFGRRNSEWDAGLIDCARATNQDLQSGVVKP